MKKKYAFCFPGKPYKGIISKHFAFLFLQPQNAVEKPILALNTQKKLLMSYSTFWKFKTFNKVVLNQRENRGRRSTWAAWMKLKFSINKNRAEPRGCRWSPRLLVLKKYYYHRHKVTKFEKICFLFLRGIR